MMELMDRFHLEARSFIQDTTVSWKNDGFEGDGMDLM